jgi:hypothetical protein
VAVAAALLPPRRGRVVDSGVNDDDDDTDGGAALPRSTLKFLASALLLVLPKLIFKLEYELERAPMLKCVGIV